MDWPAPLFLVVAGVVFVLVPLGFLDPEDEPVVHHSLRFLPSRTELIMEVSIGLMVIAVGVLRLRVTLRRRQVA